MSNIRDSLNTFLVHHKFGNFVGMSQRHFEKVWNRLTDKKNDVIVYITMEIGADPDVYDPVRALLESRQLLPHTPDTDPLKDPLFQRYARDTSKIPTYSGGLGVLAGDTLKSFADCHLPAVAISLLYKQGYFNQVVDSQLGQISCGVKWSPETTPGLYLLHDPMEKDQPLTIELPFFSRDLNDHNKEHLIFAQIWVKLEFSQNCDYFVPEFLLDFAVDANPPIIRNAAAQLYNAESSLTKAIQRRILGMGILPTLRKIGISPATFHLNEQHGVVVAMQLIAEELHNTQLRNGKSAVTRKEIMMAAEKVASRLVYTIHTPVVAGHDRFDKMLYKGICSTTCSEILDVLAHDKDHPGQYNFTAMAMRVNRSANSVSRLHRDVTHKQFPDFTQKISAITNGVHHLTWISAARADVFDKFEVLKGWRENPGVFTEVAQLDQDVSFQQSLLEAWRQDNRSLIKHVNEMLQLHRRQTVETWIDPPNYLSTILHREVLLEPDMLTFGFARRFSTYKRADLIFYDIDRLCNIIAKYGKPVYFLFAGKAHPADEPGKHVLIDLLKRQQELLEKSGNLAKLIFIPGYDMSIAKILVSGVHCWLNCPKRPLEASGTSGMKAAMNGVPNVSIMDGWWVEGYHNGLTGWKFGREGEINLDSLSEKRETLLYQEDSNSFYKLLPSLINDFYKSENSEVFLRKGIENLKRNIPIFNTHRMAAEYLQRYHLNLPDEQIAKMDGYAKLYSSDI